MFSSTFSKLYLSRFDIFPLISKRSSIPRRKQQMRTKATIIHGKAIADEFLKSLKSDVQVLKLKYNRTPHISVILVGDNAASELYVKNKITAANFVGINSSTVRLPSTASEDELKEKIIQLNNDENVDGVLLQLPLPTHISKDLCQYISSAKDVDGFTAINLGKFCLGMETIIPCTALAVHHMLHSAGINTTGKNIVVCGRSKNVGLPIALLLHSATRPDIGFGGNTTICHRYTPPEQLTAYCREADILVSATGVPSLIRGHMIKNGSTVIDVGISRIMDPLTSKTKIVGDVNFEEAVNVARFITPVPGGVGPMTVAMLMKNTFLIAKKRMGL